MGRSPAATAICDIDRSRAQALADEFGIAKMDTDQRELLADPAVEMVDVRTPTHTHLPLEPFRARSQHAQHPP